MGEEPTPAERAGATHLETSSTNPAVAGSPEPGRRSSEPPPDVDDSDLERQIVRRRRQRRTGRPWFVAAGLFAVVALALFGSSFLVASDVTPSSGFSERTFPTTPVASARRVPMLLLEPIAARNLTTRLGPVIEDAPPGTCVQFGDDGHPVATHNERAPLVPASNMKVVTAGVALELLGSGTRLTTTFLTDGRPTDGSTVRGNLYMVGGGDPLLTTPQRAAQPKHTDEPRTDLSDVADKIVATGIRHVQGSVVGDASRYDDVSTIDSWPDRYFTQGQVGRLSALIVDDGWDSRQGPASDPAQHAASVLTTMLEERGVTIDGDPTVGKAPGDASMLVEVPSLTIGEIVTEMLRFSDNTTAEMLIKEIGLAHDGRGSTAGGLAAVTAWTKKHRFPGEGTNIVDGSGLSAENRLTCSFLSAILAAAGPDGTIADGLAVPGEPGTLKDRFPDAPLHDAVRAKTGSLNGVTSLSGWLATTAGTPLDFAIIINVEGRGVVGSDIGLQANLLGAAMSYPDRPGVDLVEPAAPTRDG